MTLQQKRSSIDLEIAHEFWKADCSVWFEGQEHASWLTKLRHKVLGRRVVRAQVLASNLDPAVAGRLAELHALEAVEIVDGSESRDGHEFDLTPLMKLRQLGRLSIYGTHVQVSQLNQLSHVSCIDLVKTNLSRDDEARFSRGVNAPMTRTGVNYVTYLKQLGIGSPKQMTLRTSTASQ